MNSEPTLTRIRNARQRISAKYGHDPEKLVEHYIELQKKYQDRLVPVNTAPHQRISRSHQ
jgi:hypothetical protein